MTFPNGNLFLKTTRSFPKDPAQLTVEINQAYTEIANAANARTIGTFANSQMVTGEFWFFGGKKYQGIRQYYNVSGAGNIPHGLNLDRINITRMYGQFTNGTNWYPLPYVDVTNVNNQIKVVITPTDIQITAGAGTPPTISSGVYILEWYNR